jgi:hypothetical protein
VPLSSRRIALLSGLALLGVLGAASVCSAESPWRRRSAPPAPPPYRITLEDGDGSPLPSFRHGGQSFVLGAPGSRYNVRVSNPTPERVEVVVTIDGRDAVSGDLGEYESQRGYLIEPWGSLLIEGFRRSLDEVAAFRFTDRSQSYSALRGTPEHVGVVGVAVFPEKLRPPAPIRRREPRYRSSRKDGYGSGAAHAESKSSAPSAPSANDAAGSAELGQAAPAQRKGGPSNIGTEYGESQGSSVVEVAFERRSPTHPAAVLSLRYDDYAGLAARGIDLSALGYAYRDDRDPQPFPYSHFAPPPR